MLIKDVMVTNVRTARAEDPLRTVAAVICTNKISGLPVVDENDNLIGFVSEKDLLKTMLPRYSDFLDDPLGSMNFEAMEQSYADTLSLKVQDVMTPRVYTVEMDDPVLKAASRMHLHGFRRIPVVEGKKLVGIVSLGDIHKAIFKRELNLHVE